MTITIKLNDLVQSNGSLLELGQIATIPPKTAFAIGRVIKRTRDELKGWGEQRHRILQELFPQPTDPKEPAKVMPHPQVPGELWVRTELLTMADSKKMGDALDDLGDVDVTIDASPIKLEALGANTIVKPQLLADLGWFITE